MNLQKQISGKQGKSIGTAIDGKAAGEMLSRLKRRVDLRCEDYDTQIEAGRRDLASVVVLGYN